MSVQIKLEKVVNENLDDSTYIADYVNIDEYNNISSQNENLKLLLSYNKLKCEEQNSSINELTSKMNDMSESIINLEQQLLELKQTEISTSNEISDKNKYLNTLYDAISCMELNGAEQKPVTDPKCATLKINQFLHDAKELKDKVTDNKILLMTMCKILGCDSCKLIQSIKDLINENENLRRKSKSYEQFYLKSVALTNTTSLEFHRCGYEPAPAVTNNNLCQIHSESFDHWTKKMANTRYQMLHKKDKNSSSYPTYTPLKVEIYRNQPPPNPTPVQVTSFLQVPPPNLNLFNKNYPPPQTSVITPLLSIYPPELSNMYNSRGFTNFPQNLPHLSEYPPRANNNSIISYPRPSSSAQFPNLATPASNVKRFPEIDMKIHESNNSKKSYFNEELHNFSKGFENAYDWRNCIVEDGKLELVKSPSEIRMMPVGRTLQCPVGNAGDKEVR